MGAPAVTIPAPTHPDKFAVTPCPILLVLVLVLVLDPHPIPA
jgi:hypothetical protein